MGNITYQFDDVEEGDDEVNEAISLTLESSAVLRSSVGSMLDILSQSYGPTTTMPPVIRKTPDLRTFRHTMLYKEIKALCALPANSKRPTDHWSLTRGLQLRENGLTAFPPGSFTPNQQRRIATLFVPNKKEERLMSLEAKVFLCKFNKDGSRLITACQDSMVRVYDASKGTYHRVNRIRAKDVDWSILDIDFSPCGKYFAYSTWSTYFFVSPIDGNGDGDDMQWIELNTERSRSGIFSIRFSPCGRTLIGGCNDGRIYMCDRETRVVRTVKAYNHQFRADINALSYVSDMDSNVFVSGCNNGILRMWDTRCLGNASGNSRGRNTPVGVFLGHLDGITYIDPRNDGHYVLTNSKDQSIKIWDLRRTTPSSKVHKCTNLPYLQWDYRWDTVPREYYKNTILDGDVSIMTYKGHRVAKSLLRAKFSPAIQTGQRYIYTGCGTGRIIIYDVLTGLIKEAIEGHKDIVRDLSWHPVRSEIVSSSWDSHVNLNTFKRNLLLKRSSSDRIHGPLRRSRRIAHRNGDYEEEDQEPTNQQW